MTSLNLPVPIETIHVETVEDHTARISELQRALRKLSWRKRNGDEVLAEKIEREISRLERG